MLDIKMIRDDVETVIKRLNTRGKDFSYLRDLVKKDEERRNLITEVEQLKKERNEKSKLVGQLKREKHHRHHPWRRQQGCAGHRGCHVHGAQLPLRPLRHRR